MGKPIGESENLVGETKIEMVCIRSTYRHVESVGNTGGPPSKPKYSSVTDSVKYREGKVKSTPGGE